LKAKFLPGASHRGYFYILTNGLPPKKPENILLQAGEKECLKTENHSLKLIFYSHTKMKKKSINTQKLG